MRLFSVHERVPEVCGRDEGFLDCVPGGQATQWYMKVPAHSKFNNCISTLF